MSVQQELFDILVCPLCLGKLEATGEFLVCRESGLKYPIRDDIPIMLPEEAVLPPGCDSLEHVSCYGKRESRSSNPSSM